MRAGAGTGVIEAFTCIPHTPASGAPRPVLRAPPKPTRSIDALNRNGPRSGRAVLRLAKSTGTTTIGDSPGWRVEHSRDRLRTSLWRDPMHCTKCGFEL